MGASTLAKSPHYTQEKIQSYSDYNADWDAFLTRIRTASTQTTKSGLEALNQLDTATKPSMFKDIIEQLNLTVSPGQTMLMSGSEDEDDHDQVNIDVGSLSLSVVIESAIDGSTAGPSTRSGKRSASRVAKVVQVKRSKTSKD